MNAHAIPKHFILSRWHAWPLLTDQSGRICVRKRIPPEYTADGSPATDMRGQVATDDFCALLQRFFGGGCQAIYGWADGLGSLMVMDTVRLIDGVVRHTTAFIAELSTAAGLRAPLAHIADQVFLELSREIESQGVSRKVVASMFGMALRGYQRKVQRLTESNTSRGKTLWQAVVEHLDTHGSTPRSQLLQRFAADGEEHVAAVLRDLVESGVVYCTGKDNSQLYGLASDRDRERLLLATGAEQLKLAAWYEVFRCAQTLTELRDTLGCGEPELSAALRELVSEGLIDTSTTELHAQTSLTSTRFVIPVGSTHGWELAVFDHYRAVLDAIAAKLRLRGLGDPHSERVGGSTLVFDVHPQHPMWSEVVGLIDRVRTDVNGVWNRVSQHNRQHPVVPEQLTPVTFYFGQNVAMSQQEPERE